MAGGDPERGLRKKAALKTRGQSARGAGEVNEGGLCPLHHRIS
mgnify:FL=1